MKNHPIPLRPTIEPEPENQALPFLRLALAMTLAGDGGTEYAIEIARGRWGAESRTARTLADMHTRGFVGLVGQEGDWGHAFKQSAASFWSAVRARSLIGQIGGFRKTVPFAPAVQMTTGAAASWVPQTGYIPPSSLTFSREGLEPRKVAAIIVMSADLIRQLGVAGEGKIADDMTAAAVEAIDAAFSDPANGGVADTKPASVFHGATSIAATDDPAADLRALISTLDGNLATASLVLNPLRAARLAGPIFPQIGARGGSLLGIPAVVSPMVPPDVISLVDAEAVMIGEGEPELFPSNVADVSVTSTGELISLWQHNLKGIRAVMRTNWKLIHAGGAAYITGAAY